MNRLHYLFTGLSLTIIALSVNRLTNLTQTYLQPFEFLRWLDFNAMIIIPLASIILFYILKHEIITQTNFYQTSTYKLLSILLISGIYLFGAGSGDHEVTNYLNYRFCDAGTRISGFCNIISYNDDHFSHYVYYTGFILINVTLMLFEYYQPRTSGMKTKDFVLITINSLFIALGIFANLAFEDTALDMVVFTSVMLFAFYLLRHVSRPMVQLPVTYYFASAYAIGIISTSLYKVI